MQLIGKSDSDDTNAGLHPWDLSDHDDNELLLYNETTEAQKAFLKIGNGTSIWTKTVALLPGMTARFGLKDMLSKAALDDLGNKLTKGNGRGEFSWTADKAGQLKGRLVRLNNSAHGIESFQCDGYIVLCGAYVNGPSTLTLGQAGSWSSATNTCVNTNTPTQCTGQPAGGNITFSYTWNSSSGINGVSNSFSSGATGTATSTGAQNVSVNVSAGYCSSSASENVNVTAPPPTITVNTSGNKSTGDLLQFSNDPDACSESLGLYKCPNLFSWNVEFDATVADDASNWTISQSITSQRAKGYEKNKAGTLIAFDSGVFSTVPDGPESEFLQATQGTKNIFFLDSPGHLLVDSDNNDTYDSFTQVQNFSEKLCNKTSGTCYSYAYYLKFVIKSPGVIDTVNSKTGLGTTSTSF